MRKTHSNSEMFKCGNVAIEAETSNDPWLKKVVVAGAIGAGFATIGMAAKEGIQYAIRGRAAKKAEQQAPAPMVAAPAPAASPAVKA